jgi:fatty acid desaturase
MDTWSSYREQVDTEVEKAARHEQPSLMAWDFIETPFEGWKIRSDLVKELSQLSPLRSALHIAMDWAIVFATIVISHRLANPVVYIVALLIIGSRQHALLLLMHEATHWRLFNNKRLNDFVCEAVLTWPVLTSMRGFRYTHLAHHRRLNLSTDPDLLKKQEDPDWRFPLPRWRIVWSVAKQFTPGLGFWYVARVLRYVNANAAASGQTTRYRLVRLGYYVVALSIIIYFHVLPLFLAYWILPLFTCMIGFNKMRVLSEHPPIERATAYGVICHYQLGLLERFLLAPKHCYYHIEHHSFPSVPFFNLPRLHHELLSNSAYSQSLKPLNYWGLIKSLSD